MQPAPADTNTDTGTGTDLLGMTMRESPFFTTPASLLPISTVPMSLQRARSEPMVRGCHTHLGKDLHLDAHIRASCGSS